MEILNQNQRKSALWRVSALLGLFFAVVIVVLFSMNKAYGNQGSGEIKECQVTIDSLINEVAIVKVAHRNDTLRLNDKLANLQNNTDCEKELEEAMDDLEGCEKDLNDLLKDIVGLEHKIELLNKELAKP
ncbi:MAG: hypothetical protein ACPGWM_11985 [Flavobacteriales bacterium]